MLIRFLVTVVQILYYRNSERNFIEGFQIHLIIKSVNKHLLCATMCQTGFKELAKQQHPKAPELWIFHFRLSYENVPIVNHILNAVNAYCSDRIIWR